MVQGSAAFLGHMALFADDIRLAEPGQRCVHDVACATSLSGPGWRCHVLAASLYVHSSATSGIALWLRAWPCRRRSPSARSCGVQGECERGAAIPGVRAATGSARWLPPSRVGGCHGGRQFAGRHGPCAGRLPAEYALAVDDGLAAARWCRIARYGVLRRQTLKVLQPQRANSRRHPRGRALGKWLQAGSASRRGRGGSGPGWRRPRSRYTATASWVTGSRSTGPGPPPPATRPEPRRLSPQ
jgi:hypothetical protein